MFDTHAFCRSLKLVVAAFLMLSAAGVRAAGQTPAADAANPPSMELEVRDELNKGVETYKSARYDEAIQHFQQAAELAPSSLMAKRYLATALSQNVVPGLDTAENLKVAERAIDIFQQVLDKDPHDVNSMKQIAGVEYSIKKLDDAKEWQKKVLVEDPNDPEAAYTIGVIDWTEAHQNARKALIGAGFTDDGEGNAAAPAGVMKAIGAQNGALVEEALEYLKQAVVNRPDYDDAMAYLNLVYRRKADVDWGNEAARLDDLAKAYEWRTKAMETRRASEEKKRAGADSARP